MMVCVPAEAPLVVPVTGESFCKCPIQTDLRSDSHRIPHTHTHTHTSAHAERSSLVKSVCGGEHLDYSHGTAAVHGNQELPPGIQHFWEIKMTSPIYGTDMVRTTNYIRCIQTFDWCWGLSYTGLLHHKGVKVVFSSCYGQVSIIGLHLDTWHGTLTFCLRCGCHRAAEHDLLPDGMLHRVKSSMKLICSRLSLQRRHRLGWVFTLMRRDTCTHTCTHSNSESPLANSTLPDIQWKCCHRIRLKHTHFTHLVYNGERA
uniref:Uncharacterized protein n=1 Tax=Electrophorus electricus TaxID=8005 RepID=A0A4W4ED89_ELEEL